ncbi:MAG: MipA/OmpV family protein [Zetaproteobacteria bacterium]|nr:MipA/OmpV family protein [Zetaproteobacteria bacterium]
MQCTLSSIILVTLTCLSSTLWASEIKPKWEVGGALALASIPQYMGSNERYQLAFPVPYFIYRSPRVHINRGGIRTKILDIDSLSIDASFGGGLSVSRGNKARQGMPSLPFTFQLGPRLNWQIKETIHQGLKFHLPLRWNIDTSLHNAGWLIEPEFLWNVNLSNSSHVYLGIGGTFTSQVFNDRYYTVPNIYATPIRPSYQAGSGLHSIFLQSSIHYTYSPTLSMFAAMRYRNMKVGHISQSPLVKTPHYLSVFLGMSYLFWASDEKVLSDDED